MKYIAFLIFLAALTSCKKDQPQTCGVEDPVENIEWMNELMLELQDDCTCWISINEGLYKGEIVFYLGAAPACEPAGVTLLDCEGNTVELIRFDREDDDVFNLEFVRTLYSCREY